MSDKKTDVHGLTLRNQLCFPLYACSRETIKLYKPFLSKLDLTYTQYVAMLVVWERQQLTSKELGQELYLDSGTLTPLLKKLESKGLISRKRSEEDERNLLITVTEQGMHCTFPQSFPSASTFPLRKPPSSMTSFISFCEATTDIISKADTVLAVSASRFYCSFFSALSMRSMASFSFSMELE